MYWERIVSNLSLNTKYPNEFLVVLSVSAVKYRKNISLREGLLPYKFLTFYFFNLVTFEAVFSEIDFQGLDNDTRGVPTTTHSLCSKHKYLVVPVHYDFYFNTFAASYLNTQGLNNSCLKSPASTLVDLTFQSRALRSFSLNQLRNLSL